MTRLTRGVALAALIGFISACAGDTSKDDDSTGGGASAAIASSGSQPGAADTTAGTTAAGAASTSGETGGTATGAASAANGTAPTNDEGPGANAGGAGVAPQDDSMVPSGAAGASSAMDPTETNDPESTSTSAPASPGGMNQETEDLVPPAAAGDAGSVQPSMDAGAASGETFEGKELFILFGQSNMSGMSPMPSEPWPIDERITFMVQYDCPSLGQTKDEWLPAEPPLHGCQWANGGIGLGLADYFGKAMADAWPDSQIGLIPNAIPAVTIDVFMKGGPSPGGGSKALPDGYTSAYTLMVDRAKEAQKLGRIRGILLHQGESDYNQGFGEEWLGKLTTVVADLRADLGLTEDVPFLAGQIPPGNYDGHNVYVDQVPGAIPNSAVISSEGTAIHDIAHFDQESARIMGERYAEAFLEFVPSP